MQRDAASVHHVTVAAILRNAASILMVTAVQVTAAVQMTQQLVSRGSPGVAALMLHRLQQQATRCWAQQSGQPMHSLQCIRACVSLCLVISCEWLSMR